MDTNTNLINNLTIARQNIISQLRKQKYNVENYEKFGAIEVDAMLNNDELDFCVSNGTNKIYVKFHIMHNILKQISTKELDGIIEMYFETNETLTPDDTMIIITQNEPSDTLKSKLRFLYENDKKKYFVILYSLSRLQFDITEHKDLPKIRILTDETEIQNFRKKYTQNPNKQLPEISRFDPQALSIFVRPGQICEIIRTSETALTSLYYRICVS